MGWSHNCHYLLHLQLDSFQLVCFVRQLLADAVDAQIGQDFAKNISFRYQPERISRTRKEPQNSK